MILRPAFRARLHRWRWWLLTLGVLLAVRMALPVVVRRVLVAQASQALRAQVDIGNVDLALLRGGVVLDDVAVRALPNDTPVPSDTAPAAGPALIAWKRLAIELRYLPLFQKTLRLRKVILDSPQVALDRLQDGALNLLALAPGSGASPVPTANSTPEPTAVPKPGWRFGVDTLAVRNGALRFRDLTLRDPEVVEVDLDAIELADVAVSPGLYGEPSHARVMIEVDDGSINLDVALTLRDVGFSLDADLDAQNLPLARARLYIPHVGWSALDGRLDGALAYRLESGTRNEVRGTVVLRDLAVWLPQLQDPALAWRSLVVRVDPIDLAAHRVVVADAALTGASVIVQPQDRVLLPLLGMERAGVADSTAPTPSPAEPEANAAATPADTDAAPWHWAVTAFRMRDSLVHVRGTEAALDVAAGLTANDLADEPDHSAHVELALTAADGSVNVAGALRLQPLGFAGTLRIADLSLPELIALAPSAPEGLVEAARLGTDLTVEAGMTTEGAAARPLGVRDLRINGRLSLADARLASAAPEVSFGAQSIDLTLQEINAPGVLPAPHREGSNGNSTHEPSEVRVQGGLVMTQLKLSAKAPQELEVDAESINLAITQLAAQGLLPRPTTEASPQPPSGLNMQGNLSVAGLRVTAPGPQGFSAAASSIELALSELGAAGLLAPAGTAMSAAAGASAGSAALVPGDVHLRGRVGLTDFQMTGADAAVFAVGARSLDLPITEVSLPGILPGASPGAAARPLRVVLGDLRLAVPNVQLTRTPDGLVLPEFAPSQAAAPQPQPAPVPAAASAAPQRIEATLESVKVTGGRIGLVDRAVTPFFKGSLTPLDAELHNLQWPAVAVRSIHATIRTPDQGKIEVFGGLTGESGWLEVYGDGVALRPFNTYAVHYTTYSIGNGQLLLSSKITTNKERHYIATTVVTLHDFDLQGAQGDALFQQQFGVPLTMALALMRDLQNNIVLDVPVETSAEGTHVDVLAVVGGALRRAIVNALESPLRLIGAVFGGESGKSVAPAPITFRLGRPDFTPEGAQQVEHLGEFLASRPGVGVTLETTTSTSDARWLREQALRTEWQGQGMLAKLRGLTQRSTRDRVLQALEARGKDAAGELQDEDAAALDHWLDERPPIPPDQLRALAETRLARLADALHGAGIDPARITRREPPSELTEGAPTATVQLGAGGH